MTQPLPSETSITSLPVCVGFSFVFFFIIRGGGLLYISLLVSLDEIGIFYWRAGEGGGGYCIYQYWYVNKISLDEIGRGSC